MKSLFIKLFLIVLFIIPISASAENYYFDATAGNDANTGTSTAQAWQTIGQLNSTTFLPGDNVFFKRGETFKGRLQLHDDTGSVGNVITFDAYDSGADPVLDAGGESRVLDIRNGASYLSFNNLDLTNATNDAIFLFTGNFQGLEFVDVDISSSTSSGLNVNVGATTQEVLFQNVTIASSSTGLGFNGVSTDDRIENVTVTNAGVGVRFANSATTSGLVIDGLNISNPTDDGLILRRIDDVNISNVTITNSQSDAIWIQHYSEDSIFSDLNISTTTTGYGIRHDGIADSIQILDSSVLHTAVQGVHINGIGSNVIRNLTVESSGGSGLIYTGANSISEVTISDSLFQNNTDNGLLITGDGFATTTDTSASNNLNDGFNIRTSIHVVFDSTSADSNGVDGIGSDGDGYSWHDSSTGVLKNSVASNNKKSGLANISTTDVDVFNNIFSHTSSGTLSAVYFSDSSTARVFNNTFVNLSQEDDAIRFTGTTAGTVQNNLIYGFDTGISNGTTGSFVERNNLVFNSVTSFSGFTQSASSLTSDPNLKDVVGGDYRPNVNSIAAEAGDNTFCPATDYDGAKFGSPCDIGAFASEIKKSPGTRVGTRREDASAEKLTEDSELIEEVVISTLRPVTTNISPLTKQTNSTSDITALQTFLNTLEGTNLPIDGTYDTADINAVKAYQTKYAKAILSVWGLTEPTGYVGITTRLHMSARIKGKTAQCPVFTEYNALTQPNAFTVITASPEVSKTQDLLRDLGFYAGLSTGVFDSNTNLAIKAFQQNFKEVMLDPWNITAPTGIKYKTTNKFMNYLSGCDTEEVQLEGVGTYEGIKLN